MRSLPSCALSFALALGLALPAAAAPLGAPLGVVVLANQARVGGSPAINGSTVFAGDRLATGDGGTMQIRFGARQAQLGPASLAVVSESAGVLDAQLLSGTIHLSSSAGQAFVVDANGASVRPRSSEPAVAQVTRVSPSELLLSSRRGTLEVAFDGQLTVIAPGSTYRMLLASPDPDGPPPAGQGGSAKAPQAAARKNSKKRAIFVLLGAAAAGSAVAAVQLSGSSAPVSPSAP